MRGCTSIRIETLRHYAYYDSKNTVSTCSSNGRKLTAVFVDHSAAFDTVSHKFVDTVLQEMGTSNKVRSMIRAIYKTVLSFTTVKGADDKEVKSPSFPIRDTSLRRGVVQVQGDVTSSLLCFILALELLLRYHDDKKNKGISLTATLIHIPMAMQMILFCLNQTTPWTSRGYLVDSRQSPKTQETLMHVREHQDHEV